MHCKFIRLLFLVALIFHFKPGLEAQTPGCQYTLIMQDVYGDGWNGGTLTINSGPLSTQFTLVTGFADTVTFDIIEGQPLTFNWVQGAFLYEVSYTILDNACGVVSQVNAPNMPLSGVLYSGTGNCITCSPPINFRLDDVFDTYAKLRWSPNPCSPNPATQYRVIFGLKGFDV